MKYIVLAIVVAACGNHDNGAANDALPVNGDGVVCAADGTACTAGGDPCCSGRCDGVCLPAGTCLAPVATCVDGPTNQFCSSRCEPVQGMAGVTQCESFCSGNGAACAKATDCCDLNCNGGTCGGVECGVESDDCTTNEQCCSNICGATHKCQLDPANTTCRGLGETCNSGPQQGCCSMVCDDTQNPPRCDFGADVCKAQNSTCTTNADCCSGTCDPATNLCKTVCVANGGACMATGDCCSSVCTNNVCQMSPPDCKPVATGCTADADCCSGLCLGGFCDILQ